MEMAEAHAGFASLPAAECTDWATPSPTDSAAGDRQIVVLPLFHANAQYYSFASAIWVGASVALMHTFSASGFLPQCARHAATCASLFSAPNRMILARGEATDGVALRLCRYARHITTDQNATFCSSLGSATCHL